MTKNRDDDIDIHALMDAYVADRIYAERLLLKPILDWVRIKKDVPYGVRLAQEMFDERIGGKDYWKRKDEK